MIPIPNVYTTTSTRHVIFYNNMLDQRIGIQTKDPPTHHWGFISNYPEVMEPRARTKAAYASPLIISPQRSFPFSSCYGEPTQLCLLCFVRLEGNNHPVLIPVNDRLRNVGCILRGDEERAEDDVFALEVDGFEVAAGLDKYGVAGRGGVDTRLDGGGVAGHADDAGGRADGGEKREQADEEWDELFHGVASW